MINDPLLSFTQTFQLMGLVQCLLLLAYLAGCGGDRHRRLLASAFFIVLAAGFGLPLWPEDGPGWIPALLAAIGAGLPALSYLLAGQTLEMRLPEPRQFLILLVPLGGAVLVFIGDWAPAFDVCWGGMCLEARSASEVWQVMSGGIILLAIMALVELRLKPVLEVPQARERKGLALGLVVVNLISLAAILGGLFDILGQEEAEFTRIGLGLGFIYLATSMMFRIFPESSQFSLARPGEDASPSLPEPEEPPTPLGEDDARLLERIRAYLASEKPHLREDFHRGDMARELQVPEHRLSKVINQGFGKSLIDVLNELRVEEAKRLLAETDLQITQIAFAAGFNALPSFHRVFKKYTGQAPSDWRESHNK
jgi:AraC-like DNA-binding protein